MPLVRKMEASLWEVRVDLPERIARILFTVAESQMVLLHDFIKKSQATPANDLKLAKSRLIQLMNAQSKARPKPSKGKS